MKQKDNKTPLDHKAALVLATGSGTFCGALLVDGGVGTCGTSGAWPGILISFNVHRDSLVQSIL